MRQSLSEPDNFQTSAHNRYTSSLFGASEAGSSSSNQSSSKRREAIIKLKLAELEAQQLRKRRKKILSVLSVTQSTTSHLGTKALGRGGKSNQ